MNSNDESIPDYVGLDDLNRLYSTANYEEIEQKNAMRPIKKQLHLSELTPAQTQVIRRGRPTPAMIAQQKARFGNSNRVQLIPEYKTMINAAQALRLSISIMVRRLAE